MTADLRGHGENAPEIGHIADKKGDKLLIEDEKMRNLVMKMLEREVHKRINAKDAYDIALKIKEERDLEYKNEMLEDDYIGNNCNEEHFINDNKREYEEFWSNFNNKVSTGFFP